MRRRLKRWWRWRVTGRQGRYVAWGGGRRLDCQVGSPRDLALEAASKREAAFDRAWRELGKRSAR